MNVLIDTNVLSVVRRPAPKVLAWLDRLDEDRAFIGVASIAELRRGIALMEEGRRRAALSAWLADELPVRFAGRILPIDPGVAEGWGDLMAQARKSGVALSAIGRRLRRDRSRSRPDAHHAQRQGFCVARRTNDPIDGSAEESRNDCSRLEAVRRP